MRTVLVRIGVVGLAAAILATSACSDDDEPDASPAVVVTTSILGDVVGQLVGDAVAVEVVMPRGADPHQVAPTPRQAAAMRDADVLVVNGMGFEAGLEDTIEAAAEDGAEVVAVAELAPRHLTADGPAEHPEDHDDGDEHDDGGDHDDGDRHDHGGEDPHVFTDPARMAVAVGSLADALAEHVPGLDGPAFQERARAYVAELEALDAEVEADLAAVPSERRVLVTNHDVLGYFADRYGFSVVGTVIPSLSTLAEPSARDLHELAATIRTRGVPALFVESSAPNRLAEALAAEGLDVEVVELFTESLGPEDGPAGTYVGMVRENARRIATALA